MDVATNYGSDRTPPQDPKCSYPENLSIHFLTTGIPQKVTSARRMDVHFCGLGPRDAPKWRTSDDRLASVNSAEDRKVTIHVELLDQKCK
jgi:hypothetical protein